MINVRITNIGEMAKGCLNFGEGRAFFAERLTGGAFFEGRFEVCAVSREAKTYRGMRVLGGWPWCPVKARLNWPMLW